jgi:hypothetical protein
MFVSKKKIIFEIYSTAFSGKNLAFLKGPKREIFNFGVFAQIRPIWTGHLGTRPKNYKF